MKKILMIMMVLLMAGSTVMAEEDVITENVSGNGMELTSNIDVEFMEDVQRGFIWSIPSKVNANAENKQFTITVQEAHLGEDEMLSISLQSNDGYFALKDSKNNKGSSVSIKNLAEGSNGRINLMSVSSTSEEDTEGQGVETFDYEIDRRMFQPAGKYKCTVSFCAEIVQVNQ